MAVRQPNTKHTSLSDVLKDIRDKQKTPKKNSSPTRYDNGLDSIEARIKKDLRDYYEKQQTITQQYLKEKYGKEIGP